MKAVILVSRHDAEALEFAAELTELENDVAVVLLSDAAYFVSSHERDARILDTMINAGARIYVLRDDVEKRGIEGSRAAALSHEDLVDLLLSGPTRTINL